MTTGEGLTLEGKETTANREIGVRAKTILLIRTVIDIGRSLAIIDITGETAIPVGRDVGRGTGHEIDLARGQNIIQGGASDHIPQIAAFQVDHRMNRSIIGQGEGGKRKSGGRIRT